MKKNYIPLTEHKTAFQDSSNFIHMKIVLIHIHIENLLYHNTDAPPARHFPILFTSYTLRSSSFIYTFSIFSHDFFPHHFKTLNDIPATQKRKAQISFRLSVPSARCVIIYFFLSPRRSSVP